HEMQVAVTDAAGDDADEHLVRHRLVDLDILDGQGFVRAMGYGSLHDRLLGGRVRGGGAAMIAPMRSPVARSPVTRSSLSPIRVEGAGATPPPRECPYPVIRATGIVSSWVGRRADPRESRPLLLAQRLHRGTLVDRDAAGPDGSAQEGHE